MAIDWFDFQKQSRAEKFIAEAEKRGDDPLTFMKGAAKVGISNMPDVINYANVLQKKQSLRGQEEITSAVGRAKSSPLPAMTESQLAGRGGAALAPEQYADKLVGNKAEYFGSTEGPKTKEQLYKALGRETLSPETSFSDVQSSPAFQFAQGALPGQDDELMRARLKVQQDAEARKNKQIDEGNRLGNLRLRLQDRDLAWKYYNAGVNAQKPEFENADNWDAKAEEATLDLGEAESNLSKWKVIQKEIGKQGSDYFGAYTPEEVQANIASAETLARNAKVQRDEWHKKAKEIRTGAYERGKNISKGSPRAFQEPKPAAAPTPAAAPASGPAAPKREDIAKFYGIE